MMEKRQDEFDLSKFIISSLSLSDNISPQVRNQHPTLKDDPMLVLLDKDPYEVLGLKNFRGPQHLSDDIKGTPIQEFYRGVNIFITGVTGFLGKILLEKLIRSVPHLSHIYVLIRSKKGKTSRERFEELLEDKVFLRMKDEVPQFQSKITMLDGDISQDDLGLREEDRQLLQDKVHVVFHNAADVRFINTMRAAVNSNVLGSKRVLALAKTMNNLKSYVHVSTAYSNCNKRVIKEKCYKMSVGHKEVLQYLEGRTDEQIAKEESRLLQDWPNSYTFSKAVCEDMILEEGNDLPLCVFRPSIVWPTYLEPLRGWTDNIYGPNGMMLAAGLGVLHIYKMRSDLVLDVVPVDFTVNAMIAVAWENATDRIDGEIPVYNYTSTPQYPVLWKKLEEYGEKWKDAFPLEQAIWYHSFVQTDNETVFQIGHIFLHQIPGFVLDKLAELTGRQPRLLKIYEKIYILKQKLEYFLFKRWEFENQKVSLLWNKLTARDKQIFHFDISTVDLEEYVLTGKLGTKHFYLKENLDTLPAAYNKTKWFKLAHQSLLAVTGVIILKALVTVARILPI